MRYKTLEELMDEDKNQATERSIWFALFILSSIYLIYDSITAPGSLNDYVKASFKVAMTPFLILIGPTIFKLIFGVLPIIGIKNFVLAFIDFNFHLLTTIISSTGEDKKSDGEADKPSHINEDDEVDEVSLEVYAKSSRQLASSIYARAGVYLLVGVIVAFSGLWFFYSQNTGFVSSENIENTLILLAPKIGMLFFIEFIALFFLKQYKSAMDEFRYYEEVARRREEIAFIFKFDSKTKDEKFSIISDLIKMNAYFSKNNVFASNETTEILEAKKLEKGELDLLNSLVDVVKNRR